MKIASMVVAGMAIVCIGGCAKHLPPHEELTQAVTRSFDANGFNYSSKSRVTHLTVPKQDETAAGDKDMKYVGAVADIIRGFSVNLDGALDMKSKKSEVLYDLRYDRDNVEISVKFPILVDYNTQTIYIGQSLLNTILDIVTPQETATRGKLIRIHIPDLVRDQAAQSPELAEIFDVNRLNAKNMDAMNNIFKAMVIKSVTKLDDSHFKDLPLIERDKAMGVERRIQITLGHKETVTVILDMIDGISQALYQEGVITKKEYAVMLTLTDRQKIDELVNKIELAMVQEVGVGSSGRVRYMESRLDVSDREKKYRISLENISSFDGYDAPRFSIVPDADKYIDFKDVMEAIKNIKSDDSKGVKPAPAAPAAPEGPVEQKEEIPDNQG